jgi:hypothetical protein
VFVGWGRSTGALASALDGGEIRYRFLRNGPFETSVGAKRRREVTHG